VPRGLLAWGSATSHARDHALLASAVGGLTRHPDPPIDQLLHDPDPGATQVLHDLLLQRDQPIEPLLRDRARVRGFAETPLVDLDSIDDEFESSSSRAMGPSPRPVPSRALRPSNGTARAARGGPDTVDLWDDR
jgi:hypothetical protein